MKCKTGTWTTGRICGDRGRPHKKTTQEDSTAISHEWKVSAQELDTSVDGKIHSAVRSLTCIVVVEWFRVTICIHKQDCMCDSGMKLMHCGEILLRSRPGTHIEVSMCNEVVLLMKARTQVNSYCCLYFCM